MSRGFLMFAHNNDVVDYASQACVAAAMIKRNMGAWTTLVTDPGTEKFLFDTYAEHKLFRVFDDVIVLPYSEFRDDTNERKYRDSPWTVRVLKYHNGSRHLAYRLSPYDETLLVDTDYLIQNATLSECWGSLEDIMINREVVPLDRRPLQRPDVRLDTMSIPLWWATVVYFRKSPRAQLFFDLVEHVRENYEYFSLVYGYPRQPYRNDYAFSIATHMLNGFCETGEVKPLPVDRILTSVDSDVLIGVPGPNRLRFLVNDSRENWKNYVTNVDGVNVHCMNKLSLGRMVPELLRVYS